MVQLSYNVVRQIESDPAILRHVDAAQLDRAEGYRNLGYRQSGSLERDGQFVFKVKNVFGHWAPGERRNLSGNLIRVQPAREGHGRLALGSPERLPHRFNALWLARRRPGQT